MLAAVPAARRAAETDSWPTSFAGDRDLIVRAEDGPVADIITGLLEAYEAGELAISTNFPGVHGRGLCIFDARDESDEAKAARIADADWHDARMAEARDALDAMTADGYRIYGRALRAPDGGVGDGAEYFLNMSEPQGNQVYGWFTLPQLETRDFNRA